MRATVNRGTKFSPGNLLVCSKIHEYPAHARPYLRVAELFDRQFAHLDTKVPGVVLASGEVHGTHCAAYAFDASVKAGALTYEMGRAIASLIRDATQRGMPVIGLNESSGADVQSGIKSLHGYGEIFRAHAEAQGKILQVSAILGICCGGAVYAPALTDYILARKDSYYAVTGPKVANTVLGTRDGWRLGACEEWRKFYFIDHTDEGIIYAIQQLVKNHNKVTALPSSTARPQVGRYNSNDSLDRPIDSTVLEAWTEYYRKSFAFDITTIIKEICDNDGPQLIVRNGIAKELYTAYHTIGGVHVAILANNTKYNSGALTPEACDKGKLFIDEASRRGIPILTFVDTPGFIPTLQSERDLIEAKGAGLYSAYVHASVPKVTLVAGKGYGGAWVVMGGETTGAYCLKWPEAEIAVMGRKAAEAIKASYAETSFEEAEQIRALHGIIESPQNTRRVLFDRLTAQQYVRANPSYTFDDDFWPLS